jgi:hypothetical protein
VATSRPSGEAIEIESGLVEGLASSHNGCCFVAAAHGDEDRHDGQLLLINAAQSAVLGALGAPADNFTALEFVDDTTLMSIGPETGWLEWTIDPDAWHGRACEIAGRNLTADEWQAYLPDEPYRDTCVEPPLAAS